MLHAHDKEMLTIDQYLQQVLSITTKGTNEIVPINQAHRQYLPHDVFALLPVPPFTNSAMDGFAVRYQDVQSASLDAPVTLPVVGDIPAGSTDVAPLQPGTCQRIMTGAMVPEGADTIIPVEQTNIPPGPTELPSEIKVFQVKANCHIRKMGENLNTGERVFPAGHRLDSTALSALASVGYGMIEVVRTPRVLVISTGDELRPPGEPLLNGQIPDSNSVLLSELITEAGFEVVAICNVNDHDGKLVGLLAKYAQQVDVVITTGGISAGAFDVVKATTGDLGIHFERVKMQPGKPQAYGRLRLDSLANAGDDNAKTSNPGARKTGAVDSDFARHTTQNFEIHTQETLKHTDHYTHETDGPLFLGLPGNPVSVFVSFHLFVKPVLMKMAGGNAEFLECMDVMQAGCDWRSPDHRVQLVPVSITSGPSTRFDELDEWHQVATPAHRLGSGSHLITSLALAQGLAVIPLDQTEVKEGSLIRVIPFRTLL